ncbi:MAG: SAM-dependent chlorinase/fluorinase [Anaerolineae bacterium]|nr:SAM-dependent chlorinase/fluorinase [Anaerolineae bacterium]
MTQSIIALLTDFGSRDPYVGVMKGVILARCPTAQLVDLTHKIAAQNIRQAAYLLGTAYRYFPPETIFLVVVDPGVGTQRRALAIRSLHGSFVAPDNGVLSAVLEREAIGAAVELSVPVGSSHTFHGRDVFAPAAGLLASGVEIETLGQVIDPRTLVRLPVATFRREDREWRGEVIHCDHFGNLITSIGAFRWQGDSLLMDDDGDQPLVIDPRAVEVQIAETQVRGIRRTYGEADPDALLALISSDGSLEIAVNGGSAADRLDVKIGGVITLLFPDQEHHG